MAYGEYVRHCLERGTVKIPPRPPDIQYRSIANDGSGTECAILAAG